jgi:hypothetical protein
VFKALALGAAGIFVSAPRRARRGFPLRFRHAQRRLIPGCVR